MRCLRDMLAFISQDELYSPASCFHSARDKWDYKVNEVEIKSKRKIGHRKVGR